MLIRWFYSSKSKSCETFVFGGCHPNNNNFLSKDECMATCQPELVDLCHQPKKIGPCRSALLRYWYNAITNKCEKFLFGGCRGNHNNFLEEDDCLANCSHMMNNTTTPSSDVLKTGAESTVTNSSLVQHHSDYMTTSIPILLLNTTSSSRNITTGEKQE